MILSASAAVFSTRAGLAVRSAVIAYVVALIAVPLAALACHGLADGPISLWKAIAAPEAAHALILTLWTSGLVAVVNGVMGAAAAWVLVRYDFPGRRFLSTLIDLPLAIPTLVAGIMLVVLFGPASPLGAFLSAHNLPVAFAVPSIVAALGFVTLPFAVRTVEPVIKELDPAEEEAAWTMGASRFTTFWRVILPSLAPSIAAGALQCFSRAIAEFGSVIVVSGNIPHQTLTAPVFVFGEVESGRSAEAAAVSVVLFALALGLTLAARTVERFSGGADA